ncbi:MAG TPA: hypothetical protein DEG17_15845 [Cyanobacteria bacterium UBA11149]|nr:hypothetical protein [Cyanobacteria bacterium UBA11367]HBE56197.1 hypothetical protein [Cyanobacteria bacterium UBA11366]HBK65985.1 hypothetical protein [Cyanobacteria bacterium UBA11166]HBR75604.1 hypothetical protein [Cyanobacteria bacterium UBA11159]HBS68477.1 hypothetical protein [Cyanobacteria bacterium UBA11153]HBW90303.1 hypothetical protein [Cyanobacteria bacterium UBA11149]HCA95422.1 hypothetical protein [Cyanobacteria bacterium UBA9226]
MKNGTCRACGSHEVRSNRNRKFPALNTITLTVGSSVARYASLDTYVCVTCGYVENYVTSTEDLEYIQENWASVGVRYDNSDRTSENGYRMLDRELLGSIGNEE